MNRYSSRRHKLDQQFLNEKLKNAVSYDRIAGYFYSSILEVAGEKVLKTWKARSSLFVIPDFCRKIFTVANYAQE